MAATAQKVKQQLAQISQQQAATAPSMVPVPYEGKKRGKPKPEEQAEPPLPNIEDIIANKVERARLVQLIEDYGGLCQEQANIKKSIEILKPLLKQAALKHKLDKVNCGKYRFSYHGTGVSKSIKAELLLAHGVLPDVIADCTVEVEKDKAVKVTLIGESDEEL